jgi:glycosyltransferase involved in cell wall biosynthesis
MLKISDTYLLGLESSAQAQGFKKGRLSENMVRPILSILIPTRNRSAYLKHAIESALNISDENTEVIVSENHSEDESLRIAKSFADKRLTVLVPDKPLPMHSNWEFLVNKARGEWVYFLGDDDAMMPHAAAYLRYITDKHPACEAIVTPRAYYFWHMESASAGGIVVSAHFSNTERWIDSKKVLADLLNAKGVYFSAPQMYSGGFQRRSLIKRVLNAQNGIYFKSVTPDAYSALMGCVHTYRFLLTDIPIAWVGTSDTRSGAGKGVALLKDRNKDFYGMHNDDDLIIHRALGDLKTYTLPLVFYEAYLSAFPTTSYTELNRDRLLILLADARRTFFDQGNEVEFISLLDYLGVKSEELDRLIRKRNREKFYASNRETICRCCKKFANLFRTVSRMRNTPWTRSLQSNSYEDYPNILVANSWAKSMFDEFMLLN